MDIYQLLPLLDGWKRLVIEKSNVRVSGEMEIDRVTQSGWIIGAIVNFTGSEDTVFTIRYHDRTGKADTISASPRSLYNLGLVDVESLHGAVLCKADSNTKNYTMLLSPNKPIPFFASKEYPLSLIVVGECVINYLGCEIVLIIDREKFVSSLRRVIG